MAVLEKDVLAFAVRLPILDRVISVWVYGITDAILRIIVLVGVVWLKIDRVARQHIGSWKSNPFTVNGSKTICHYGRRERR